MGAAQGEHRGVHFAAYLLQGAPDDLRGAPVDAVALRESARARPDERRSPGASGPAEGDIEETIMPSRDELRTVAHTRVLFGHDSVGTSIIDGIVEVYERAGLAPPHAVRTDGNEPLPHGGVLGHAHVGTSGDPLDRLAAFEKLMDGPAGEDVGVALALLCYADVIAATDAEEVFSAYERTMADLEARHPDVVLLYSTVPLTADPPRTVTEVAKRLLGRGDTGPADNPVRERYNVLVRQRYAGTGRLFDIAALESTSATSPQRRTTRDGRTYHVLHRAFADDGGHLNRLGSRAAATELVRDIAAAVS